MRSFIGKISLFLLLFLVSAALFIGFDIFVVGNQYLQNYQAAILDKVERLESLPSPKIILVGNSNLAFGINSKLIEKECGMPVVNLGLHGGLGNAFHENIAKLNIGQGDIVILCHTDFSNDTIVDPDLACITLECHRELWHIPRRQDMLALLKAYPNYVVSSAFLWATGRGNQVDNSSYYTRGLFNEYGDYIYERPFLAEYSFENESVSVPEISDDCMERINALNTYVEEQGAQLLIAAYPICDIGAAPDKVEFEMFQEKLQEKSDAEVISDYTDYYFPKEYFYESTLHLTNEGADLRTEQLIQDLKGTALF